MINVEKAISSLKQKEPVWFINNSYSIRRNWMKLSIGQQQQIIKSLKIPVVLPSRVDRFHLEMRKAYDIVFAYAKEHDLMDRLAIRIDGKNS